MRIHRIKPIYGRLFFVKDLGIFQLDEDYRYILGRSEVYFFAQKCTNPISIAAFVNWQQYAKRHNKRTLDFSDLAKFVDKIRKVEEKRLILMQLRQGNAQENIAPVDNKIIAEMLFEGSIDYQSEKASSRDMPSKEELKQEGLEERSIMWLNGFFKEDAVSRFYLNLRQVTDDKFKLPDSPLVRNYMLIQSTTGKQNIVFIIINNTIIEVDVNAQLQMNNQKGHYELVTKKYGTFQNIDPQTRYMYGRQRIFIVLVNTSTKPFAENEDLDIDAEDQAEELQDEISRKPQLIAHSMNDAIDSIAGGNGNGNGHAKNKGKAKSKQPITADPPTVAGTGKDGVLFK